MSDTVAELKPELTIDQQLAILSRATPGKLAETYLRLRDKRDAYQAQADSFQKKMDLLETALLAKLTELSQDGFNATGYTIYKYTLVTGRIADPLVARNFVLTDPPNRIGLLEMRASIAGMDAYRIANSTTVDPDGFTRASHNKLGARKVASKKKKT